MDLVGGYYDAGDNVKFGLPMAFTVTMMSWGILEYGRQMAAAGELRNAMDAVKWGTDYFIKAHPEPEVLYGEVGDGDTDHSCWQRPEDMSTSRQAFRIEPQNPGSDLAGETAAAMAAAAQIRTISTSMCSISNGGGSRSPEASRRGASPHPRSSPAAVAVGCVHSQKSRCREHEPKGRKEINYN